MDLNIWSLLRAPFVNALIGLYQLTGNLGWSIILTTLLVRVLLWPLIAPSMKAAKKMQKLQPKLKKIQEKFKNDKNKLAQAQLELYKQEGVNPTSGCLPQILQIAVLIIFFNAFNLVIGLNGGKSSVETINRELIPYFQLAADFKFNPDFFGSNVITTPKETWQTGGVQKMILPLVVLVLSGFGQYLGAKMMMPKVETEPKNNKNSAVNPDEYTKATPGKEDDMAAMMRTQSMYMMPLMTLFIGWSFSLGMLLYWAVNSVAMVGQQWLMARLNRE
jgi:YidC/Oxa1 family membrane protein insertase